MIRILLLLFIFSISFSLHGQITINTQDLPSAGQTFKVSIGIIDPVIDPLPTGLGYIWDFSNLQWESQTDDQFLSVAAAGITYSFVFSNLPTNANRCNLATKGPGLPSIPGLPIDISETYNFYYNSADGYEQKGIGLNISGFGVPVAFNSKDIIYNFPMNFGDSHSSYSDYQLTLPGLGYYGHEQVRESEVDGWGTLTTPFGTFNALRVKSVITPKDTLFLDTLGFGFGFSLPPTVEYKWLGENKGIPLLQINTSIIPLLGEVVTLIRYRDSIRPTVNDPDPEPEPEPDPVNLTLSFSVFPSPSTGPFNMQLSLPSEQNVAIRMYSIEGKMVADLYKGRMAAGIHDIPVISSTYSIAAGYYIIEAVVNDIRMKRKVLISHPENK